MNRGAIESGTIPQPRQILPGSFTPPILPRASGGGPPSPPPPPTPSTLLAFPNRLDLSVNKANVDNTQSASPVITTRTGTNPAGAFNGGGLGNKGILGIQGFDGTALSALTSIEYVWREMEAAHSNPLGLQPYLNLIIEPDPDLHPGVYKILTIGNTDLPIFCCAPTALAPGRWDYLWKPAPTPGNPPYGPNVVQVVLDFAAGPLPIVPPDIVLGPTWPSHAYFMSTILAAFPNARLRDVSTLDGGLPKTTVTPALLVIIGDSNNVVMVSRLIESVKVNGSSV